MQRMDSWPLNNTLGMNCTDPLILGFLSRNTDYSATPSVVVQLPIRSADSQVIGGFLTAQGRRP